MDFRLRKWRLFFVVFLGLLSVYVVTRIYNLTALPIFTDEAIYIRWSQIGSRDASWRFISLTDGKQPLFTWIMMVFLRFTPDPLAAGRLVSVFAGTGTLVGIMLLSYELFRRKGLSLVSGFLYVFSPFALVYDRMALYDSLTAALYVWSLYLAVRLIRSLRLDVALLLGMTIGVGMLNKTIGFLSLYLMPTSFFLFDFRIRNRFQRFSLWVLYFGVVAILSLAMYSILRLSPLFHMISLKDNVFVYTIREWLSHPFLVLLGNLNGLFDWLRGYLTVPLFFAAFVPLIRFWHAPREKVLLYAWWLLPFLALALFGKVLYPRFILFMAMPLLILSGYSIFWLYTRYGKSLFTLGCLVVITFPSLYADYFIVTNPLYAPIPQSDRGQFIDDWPSGWGVKEVNSYLLAESQKGKVSVYTEGTFGLLPYAVEIYLVDKENIKIRGLWPLGTDMPETMKADAHDHSTYLVLNLTQTPPQRWGLSLISEYQKGRNTGNKLRLYQVLPEKK